MIHGAVWYCNDCKQTFDTPKRTHDGGTYDEPWYVCPHCGSDDYQLAEWCAECDEVFPQSKLHNGFCDDCLEKLVKEHGAEFIKDDEDLFKEEFSWWMHKRMRARKGVSA